MLPAFGLGIAGGIAGNVIPDRCVVTVNYRYAPDRKQARWHWVSWGAAAATALWLCTSLALRAYVDHLGTYESTYGSLASAASRCSASSRRTTG